jgi:CheY-like chemotaxis protein
VRPGRFLCLSVTDTGSGIPADHLSRIFEPFFTTKQPGIGTGLGLATVYRIATQHRGWIEVHSEVDRGTTARVYFPALAYSPRQVETESAALPHGQGESILLVEDDESLRAMARAVLERFGYRVVEAPTATIALQRWQKHRGAFDLLITDLVLPAGLSGGDLARRLLSDKPALRVIYTTGYSSDVVTRQVPAAAASAVLSKPFSADALVLIVRRQIERGPDPAG